MKGEGGEGEERRGKERRGENAAAEKSPVGAGALLARAMLRAFLSGKRSGEDQYRLIASRQRSHSSSTTACG